MIGQLVCRHLSHFDIKVLAYDPFVPAKLFDELGVERADSLEDIFCLSDAVSLHTPWLPQTEGMINGQL